MSINHEAMMEYAVLGSVIIEDTVSDLAEFVFDELNESEFYSERCKRIFLALKEMHASGEAIDLVTITAKLKANGELADVGGEVFISELLEQVSTTRHIRHYVSQVKKNAVMRQIRREVAALNPSAEPEAVERIMQLVQLRDSGNDASVVSAGSLVDEYISECEQGRSCGLKTGYPTFDENFHAQPGDLVVVAARTNVGKTAFLTNILSNMLTQKIPCLYCATEMRPKQFLDRIFPLRVSVPASSFRARKFKPEDIAELQSGTAEMKEFPLSLLDIASPTIGEIKRALKGSQAKVLFVDYLGRCSTSHEQTRMREIEKFVVELKNECVKNGILCFLAVQLNRRTDFDNTPPKLADLSDSSAVEKEADSVVFLWRNPRVISPSVHMPVIEAFFGKNRFGYTHKWGIGFNRTSMRMTECELEYKDGDSKTKQD
jgi:replicative DNA helicase